MLLFFPALLFSGIGVFLSIPTIITIKNNQILENVKLLSLIIKKSKNFLIKI